MAVDRPIAAGGRFRPDAEGLTIVYLPGGGGYLIASSQAGSNTLNSYLVYDRLGSNAFIREFRVVDGPKTDGCGWTDGIDALAADLGPRFPHGIFICQDNENPCRGRRGIRTSSSSRSNGSSACDGRSAPAPRHRADGRGRPELSDRRGDRGAQPSENAGFTVAVIDDNVVTAADANGTAFVFVSSTVNANTSGPSCAT